MSFRWGSCPPPPPPDQSTARKRREQAVRQLVSAGSTGDVDVSDAEVVATGSDPVPRWASEGDVVGGDASRGPVVAVDRDGNLPSMEPAIAAAQQAGKYRERGNAAFRAQRLDEAAALYGMGITTLSGIAPERLTARLTGAEELGGLPQLLANRAAVHAKQGNAGDALNDLDRAVSLQPTYAKAHFRRGTLLQQMGQQESAADALRRALELEPENKQIRRANDSLLARLGRAAPPPDAAARARKPPPAAAAAAAGSPPKPAAGAAPDGAQSTGFLLRERGRVGDVPVAPGSKPKPFTWGTAPGGSSCSVSPPAATAEQDSQVRVASQRAPALHATAVIPGDEDVVWEPIHQFAFSDEMAKVKVYIDLAAVGDLSRNRVTCSFDVKSLDLRVRGYRARADANFQNLRFHCIELWDEIDASACKMRVKQDSVVITLTKGMCANDRPWEKLRA